MKRALKNGIISTIFVCTPLLSGQSQSAPAAGRLKGSSNIAVFSVIDVGHTGSVRSHSVASKDEYAVPEALFAKARVEGSVRVIVQLRIAPAAGESREQAIRSARNTLLGELAGAPHKVLRSYDSIPSVVLEVAVDGLNVLRASSQVIQVSEDRLLRPFQDQSRPAPLHRTAESMT